jgi:ATP-dependent Clp protease protease subunit
MLSLSPTVSCSGPACGLLKSDLVIIEITSEFDTGLARSVEEQLQKAEESGQPFIPIVVSSYGGSVYELLEIIDILKTTKKPLMTIVLGKAMSAGVVLSSFGREGMRYCSPNSTLMIHEVSGGTRGKMYEMEIDTAEARRLNKTLMEMLATNIGKDKDWALVQLATLGHIDWFLSPEQAKEINLCNHIRIPKIKISTQVDVTID